MRIVGIDFDNGSNGTHTLGYLRIPDDFSPSWQIGFRTYLANTYKATNIKIYPLNVPVGVNATDIVDDYTLRSRINMDQDFNNAINCTKAYPECDENNAIRRQWQTMYPSVIHTYI